MTDATQCTIDRSVLNTLGPTVEKRHTYAFAHHTDRQTDIHTHSHTSFS